MKVDFDSDGYHLGGRLDVAEGARLSDGVILAPYGGHIDIGRRVFVGPYSVLYGYGGLKIGDDVLIAANVSIITSHHGIQNREAPINRQPIAKRGVIICNNVWIGAGVKILDGVTIGEGAVVGAGAVVNKDVPSFCIAVGTPAKIIKNR